MPFIATLSILSARIGQSKYQEEQGKEELIELMVEQIQSRYLPDLTKTIIRSGVVRGIRFIYYFPSYHSENVDVVSNMALNIKRGIRNLALMIPILALRRSIKSILEKTLGEFNENKILLYSIIFIITVYQARVFLGVWYYGIAGWTEGHHKQMLDPDLYLEATSVTNKSDLLKGLNLGRWRRHGKPGTLSGLVILGYKDGESFALTEEYTQIVFSSRFRDYDETPYIDLFNRGLRKLNREGLMRWFRYPSHTVNQTFSEQTLNLTSIDRVEFWNVTVSYDFSEARIVKADLVRAQ